MCPHAHMYVHTRMYAHMHVHTHAHVPVGAFLHALCVQAYTCTMYPCTRACVRSYTYKYPHRVQICTRACMYMCPRTRPCVSVHAYTCIHTRVHVHTHASTRARVYMYDVCPSVSVDSSSAPWPHPGLQRQCLVSHRARSLPTPLCAHAAEGPASGTHSHSQLLPARIFYDDHKLPLQQKDIYFGNLKRADSEDTHCDDAEAVKGTCPTTSRRSDSILQHLFIYLRVWGSGGGRQ